MVLNKTNNESAKSNLNGAQAALMLKKLKMTNERSNVGVVGCGSMGRRRVKHALALGFKNIFTWDIRLDRREMMSKKFPVSCNTSENNFFENKLDIMFICVPPAEHRHFIDKCIEHEINFMVEQPICSKLNGLEQLAASIREAKIISHVSSNKSKHPALKKIKDMVKEKVAGNILTGIVEIGEWLPDWHPYEPYTDYYPSKVSMGGGLDAVCEVEWLNDIFGEVERVLCLSSKRSSLDIDTHDVAQFLISYENGPQIVLHTDMLQRTYSHFVKLIGDEGTIIWDFKDNHIQIYQHENRTWKEIVFENNEFLNMQPMEGKQDWGWVEEMYFLDSSVFIEKFLNKDFSTASLEKGIDNLKIVRSSISEPFPWVS